MADDNLFKEAPPSYSEVAGQQPPGYTDAGKPASYPPQPQGAYPQQPQGAYPQQPQGAYPQQPQGAYPAAPNYSSNVTVVRTQPTAAVINSRIKPDNYLALSLFSLFCCCWLLGIIALIYSLQVDSAWNSGDVAAAHRASRSARGWNMAAIIGGIVVGVVVGVMVGVLNSIRFIV